jgi:hypothetical protein
VTVLIRRPLFDKIEDVAVRDSLQWIFDYVTAEGLLQSNFKHFELEFRKAETEVKVPHGLGFSPIDIMQTYKTGAGAITFVYEKFDTTNLVITTTGACVVRFFAGRYQVL